MSDHPDVLKEESAAGWSFHGGPDRALIYQRVRNLLGDPDGRVFNNEAIEPFIETENIGSIPLIAAAIADSKGWPEVGSDIRKNFGIEPFVSPQHVKSEIEIVVAAERERCAKIAEELSFPFPHTVFTIPAYTRSIMEMDRIRIATKIRSGD